jgi:hypothetical protein
VGVLRHLSTFISVKEDIVYVEGSSNEGLVVGSGNFDGARVSSEGTNSPEALINRTDIKVDLDFVVLEGNQREGKTRVTAEPELEGNVESGLRESVTRSADLARSIGVARTIDVGEGGVGDEGKLGSVTDHLVVTTLLFGGKSKLVPDVHPVTILTVNTLTTDLNLNLGDKLLTREV